MSNRRGRDQPEESLWGDHSHPGVGRGEESPQSSGGKVACDPKEGRGLVCRALVVLMLLGVLFVGMVVSQSPALAARLAKVRLFAVPGRAPDRDHHTTSPGAEDKTQAGGARLPGEGETGTKSTRGMARGARGAGGREWPLVFLIGRQKAASTSVAEMMFGTHLFCQPYPASSSRP